MKPIIHNGEEFKDELIVISKFKLTLWQKILILFGAELIVRHDVFTKEIMPARKAICQFTVVSYLDLIKSKFCKHKGLIHLCPQAKN